MKKMYFAAQYKDEHGRMEARTIAVSCESGNVVNALEGADTAIACETKKRADQIAAEWNSTYKINGYHFSDEVPGPLTLTESEQDDIKFFDEMRSRGISDYFMYGFQFEAEDLHNLIDKGATSYYAIGIDEDGSKAWYGPYKVTDTALDELLFSVELDTLLSLPDFPQFKIEFGRFGKHVASARYYNEA